MTNKVLIAALGAVLALSWGVPVSAGEIAGRASVIDGDTIEIAGQRIRLHGIDAPESGQTCRTGSGASVRCGRDAAFALADRVGSRPVICEVVDVDRYGRSVAVCAQDGEDLNAWMVLEGHALAYRRYSDAYIPHERAARTRGNGIWAYEFDKPWRWRREN